MVTSSNAADVQDRDSDPPAPVQDPVPATSLSDGDGDGNVPRSPLTERRRFRYTLPGAWVAVIFVCLAFTPSLVPRPGTYQGVVCGMTGAIGYGLGVLGARVWREFADRSARAPRPRSWRVFLIVAAVALLVSYVLGQRWQGQIRDLMERRTGEYRS